MLLFQDLIIEADDNATVSGVVVERHNEFGLLTNAEIASFGQVDLNMNAVIKLSGLSTQYKTWLVDRIDSHVKLSGRWTGTNLALNVGSAKLEDLPQANFSSPTFATNSVRPEILGRKHSSQSQSIENSLKNEGVLLSIWAPPVNDESGIVYAIATDVDLVHRMLDPFYENSLMVIKSRWDSETIESLRQVFIQAPPGIVLSLGESHTNDHQIKIRARLRYLSRGFAELLSKYPLELLEIIVAVQPIRT